MYERRTVDEIVTRYMLEPELKDVFVEGTHDKYFVEWYLRSKGIKEVSVYPIGEVEVPDELLNERKLPTHSNRSRVIELATQLSEQLPHALHVLCLADRDLEDYCPVAPETEYLVLTDCNSIDLYAFTPHTLSKFCAVALGGVAIDGHLLQDLVDVLKKQCSLRMANEELGWGMTWVPIEKYVKVSAGGATLDEDRLVKAYLNKNQRSDCRQEFADQVAKARARLTGEDRRCIRGHDLAELLLIAVRKLRKGRVFEDEKVLEGCLLASVDCAELDSQPFFMRIAALAAS